MKRINHPLRIKMKGTAVAELHKVLNSLGFSIDAKEMASQRFGQYTRKAVMAFQKKKGITTNGEVDKKTATLLNQSITKAETLSQKTYLVKGIIQNKLKKPIEGLIVKASDQDFTGENPLGSTATTNNNGEYAITYKDEDFRIGGKETTGADIIIRIFDTQGNLIGRAPAVKRNAPRESTIDVTVDYEKEDIPTGDGSKYTVMGAITYEDGQIVSGIKVGAFDKDLRSEQALGTDFTNNKGNYQISYSPAQFQRAEKQNADLFIKVYDINNEVIASSTVLFNAPTVAVINLSIPAQQVRPPSEFMQINHAVRALLEDLVITELEEDESHQDISFLSGETGFVFTQVEAYAISHRLIEATDLPGQFWYALLRNGAMRDPLPATEENPSLAKKTTAIINKAVSLNIPTVQRTLTLAIKDNLISEFSEKTVTEWINQFEAFLARKLLENKPTGARKHIGEVLNISKIPASKQERFAQLYLKHQRFGKELKTELQEDESFNKKEIDRLESNFALVNLTTNHIPLVRELKKTQDTDNLLAVKKLAAMDKNEWKSILKRKSEDGTAIGAPTYIAGKNEKEKIENYANLLSQKFESTYPTAAFEGKLKKDANSTIPDKESILIFLDKNPDFELVSTSVDRYLDERRVNTNDTGTRQGLKRVQRVFKLAPRYDATNTLLKDNIHSAHRIYNIGESKFANKYATKPGFDEKTARSTFRRAEKTHAATVTLVSEVKATENAAWIKGIGGDTSALKQFPNWQNLFGRADICECEHCRSVYSPSAYFADILQFLENRDAVAPAVSSKDILFKRRPDLGYIELSCNNSHTPLPYIDLVNEALEEAIAPETLFNLPAVLEGSLNEGPTSNAIKNAFANAGHSLTDMSRTSDKDKYGAWVIRDETITYKVVKKGVNLEITELRQTRASREELEAFPTYVNDAAYVLLKSATHPFNLPFDLYNEEVRAYLDRVNIKRWELMQTLKTKNAPTNPGEEDIAAEYFGISIDETATIDERTIILSADPADQADYWGENNLAATLTAVSKVDVFLNKTGLKYTELLQMIDLPYINPDKDIGIVHLDTSCDLDKKRIQVLDEHKLDRMHRFIRLWKKLGWKPWELDMVIKHAQIGNGLLNSNFIIRLKEFDQFKSQFKRLSISQACAIFGNIDTVSKFSELHKERIPSLYEKLFLNKLLINPINPAFEINTITGLNPVALLQDHLSTLMAVLRVKEDDLNILINLKKPDNTPYIDDKVSLNNLSFLYKHSLVASLLRINIAEWEILLQDVGVDIFQDIDVTLQFLQKVETYKNVRFKVDEIHYLLTADRLSEAAPGESKISVFLSGLRDALQTIDNEYDINQNFPFLNIPAAQETEKIEELLQNQVARLNWSEEEISQLINIYKNEAVLTFPITSLPANFDFPQAIKDTIDVRYDENNQQLTFTGMMTNAEKATLLTDASLNAVTGNVDYQAAIEELFILPRLQLKFYRPLFDVSLEKLPDNVIFDTEQAMKISYDIGQKRLVYEGIMGQGDKRVLENLSADLTYTSAIQALYDQPKVGVFAPEALWMEEADLLMPLSDNYNQNIKEASKRLLAYLKRYLSDNEVIQQFSDSLGNTFTVTEKLLNTFQLFAPGSTNTILQDFTDPVFINSINALEYGNFKNWFDSYYWLHKVTLLVQKLNISINSLDWWIKNHAASELLDPSSLPIDEGSTPVSFDGLIMTLEFFAYNESFGTAPDDFIHIVQQLPDIGYTADQFATDVNTLIDWPVEDIKDLTNSMDWQHATTPSYTSFPDNYLLVRNWKKLAAAMTLLRKLNSSAIAVQELTNPSTSSVHTAQLKEMLKSKYESEVWLELSKKVQDKLRERKRDSLVAYLLTQPAPADVPSGKWENANDLYAYYLIDVEMNACQPTSRIVQASGAVQLFVQRCFMGLEPEVKPNEEEDNAWRQWKWMKNYRVWEANRKVFLYPENWIEPELRKNKSELFADLENELLQNEINTDNVETVFLNYIEKLDGIAQLEIAGTYYEEDENTLHVFGRTPGSEPHVYYHRKWIDDRYWTPWKKLNLDISTEYLVPLMVNKRLYLLWPEFQEEPVPFSGVDIPAQSEQNVTIEEPWKISKIRLAISEFRNDKWSAKKVSKDYIQTSQYKRLVEKKANSFEEYNKSALLFIPLDMTWFNGQYYILYYDLEKTSNNGIFELLGCKGYPEKFSNYSNVKPAIVTFLRSGLKYMKHVENSGDGNLTPQFGYAPLSTILNLTPNIFKVSYPHQLSYFDKLLFLLIFYIYAVSDVKVSHDRFLFFTLGTLMNWFYADKDRTFFVRPHLHGENGSNLYHKEMVDLVKEVIELLFANKTEELAELLKEYFEANYSLKLLFQNFYHPFTCHFAKELYNRGIDGLMSRNTQLAEKPFNFFTAYSPNSIVRLPYPKEDVDFSGDGSYATYNWELFYHAPLMIAQRLSQNQRFEEAMQWYHYIFNPIGLDTKDPRDNSIPKAPQKFWITKPFFDHTKDDYTKQRIDNILKMLASDPNNPADVEFKEDLERQVADWRSSPFDPHIIAQFRQVAYQKTTVTKYLDNLIAWGDNRFRQDTMESVNEATQLYVLAAEILGPRPQKVPPQAKPAIATFNELESELDAFSNALVEVENLIPEMGGMGDGPDTPTFIPSLNILYFCIPQNDKLLGYWDTVADRLFKIRNCLNISGVARTLDLFAPPIDPGALVKAAAAGLDIGSVLSELNTPTPLYRFTFMLQKANEFCSDVKSLGGALLSALEKKDAEAFSLLRQAHEVKLLEAIKSVREKQLEEATENVAVLKLAEKTTETRRNFYQDIEKTIAEEKQQMDKLSKAHTFQEVAQGIQLGASIASLIPAIDIGASGFGGSPLAKFKFGGLELAQAAKAASEVLCFLSTMNNNDATRAAITGSQERRWNDWKLQEKLANKELDQVKQQIAVAEIRVALTEQELKNHELQIENAKAVDEFMQSKYTNKELYDWMITKISQVYFQSYRLAYDIAKMTEKCYRYEMGLDDSAFIQFGYWDSLKKGLLSGEKLQTDLRRMETAYLEKNKRDYEITKHISLLQVNPFALIQLRENGFCQLSLPEELFDMDYPGHYFRRIKSVSMTIPAIAGPYTSVNCTLRLLKNNFRINTLDGDDGYVHNHDSDGLWIDDTRFRESKVPVKSIATSTAQDDSGVFELSFRDERYLPFEGAGAISTWLIELPHDPADPSDRSLRQFDYDTITDVIIHLKYTTREDAGLFRQKAVAHLKQKMENALGDDPNPLKRMLNIPMEFPTQWHRFLHKEDPAADNILELEISKNKFPFFTRNKDIVFSKIHVLAKMNNADEYKVQLSPPLGTGNTDLITLTQSPQFGNLHYGIKDVSAETVNVVDDPANPWIMKLRKTSINNFHSIAENEVTTIYIFFEYSLI